MNTTTTIPTPRPAPPLAVTVAPMGKRHLGDVLSIGLDDPQSSWGELGWSEVLAAHHFRKVVAISPGGRVVGYAVVEEYPKSPGRIGLVGLAVAPAFRRRGVGRALVASVRRRLSAVGTGPRSCGACVPEWDDNAIRFLAATGWLGRGVLRGDPGAIGGDLWTFELKGEGETHK